METDLLRLSFLPEKCMFELIERPYKFGDYGGEGKDAMNKVKRKLKNQTGASITFALLLFLVCAVLSSVIIVAATAASGRMAGIAEADQRYYNVTSACRLLEELIDGKSVSVVRETTSWTTTEYKDGNIVNKNYNMDGTVPKSPIVKEYLILDKTAEEIINKINKTDTYLISVNQFSGEGAAGTTLKNKSFLNDAAYKYYNHTLPLDEIKSLALQSNLNKITVHGEKLDPLAVTIEEYLDSDADITLTVYNTNGDPYKMELLFGADVHTRGKTVPKDGPKENIQEEEDGEGVNHISYTITTNTTVTEITSLKWTLNSIRALLSLPVD